MNRGHLEEKSPNRWRYRAPAPKSITGKPRQHSRTFHAVGRKAAEKIATKLLAEWDKADDTAANSRDTLATLVGEYEALRARKDSPATIYRRKAILNRIRADLGHLRLDALTARHLDAWYADLATRHKLSANTVRQYHATVRAILQLGWDYDRVPANVAAKAHPPERTRTDQTARMPTVAAISAMLGQASRSVRMAVLLAAATGSRCGEIVGLRWTDIDAGVLTVERSLTKPPGCKLTVKGTKTGAVKRIPLPEALLVELARYRQESREWAAQEGARYVEDGPILAHQRKDPTGRTPHTPQWLSQEWERLCKRAGVAPFTLHGLRHMHGSLLADAGVSLATIAKRQGHGVQVLAERYLHPVDGADVLAAETIGVALAELLPATDRSE